MPNESRVKGARELDVLYQKTDKIYYEFARGCGISETAYWILYALEVSGGSATQARIAGEFSYSKQTVNSALKTLAAKGLVELSGAPDDRRGKLVSLTAAGRAFSDERIVPAIEAEDRAFASLEPEERSEFLRLAAAYTAAIDRELSRLARRTEDTRGGAPQASPDEGGERN